MFRGMCEAKEAYYSVLKVAVPESEIDKWEPSYPEEDYELRQIGNVIEETSKTISVYELGYNKRQPSWRICAILYVDNTYLIGWYNSSL